MKILIVIVLLLLIGLGVFFWLPYQVGASYNQVSGSIKEPSDAALALHQSLTIADLHADSLLWVRDLSERGDWGHTDLPRLREGNVALQTFSAVTHSPRGLNVERNSDETDSITPLVIAQRWPLRTWSDRTERTLYQAERLHALAES